MDDGRIDLFRKKNWKVLYNRTTILYCLVFMTLGAVALTIYRSGDYYGHDDEHATTKLS